MGIQSRGLGTWPVFAQAGANIFVFEMQYRGGGIGWTLSESMILAGVTEYWQPADMDV